MLNFWPSSGGHLCGRIAAPYPPGRMSVGSPLSAWCGGGVGSRAIRARLWFIYENCGCADQVEWAAPATGRAVSQAFFKSRRGLVVTVGTSVSAWD